MVTPFARLLIRDWLFGTRDLAKWWRSVYAAPQLQKRNTSKLYWRAPKRNSTPGMTHWRGAGKCCGWCILRGASTDSARRAPMREKQAARREFLRNGAALAGGLTLSAAAPAFGQQAPAQPPMIKGEREGEIGYGARSKYTTSVRIPHGGRPTPDTFGLTFHVASPLQDQVGVITPSSLHYYATTRGAFLPDIDPGQHTLMIHGLVDRPLTFTVNDLKRLPSVTRLHFIECAGNRASRRAKTVQETHGMASNAEWTGVLLSTLLKECGVKGSAKWFVAEGAEEVKGASSMPVAKT